MEVKSENTQALKKFFTLFNEVLSKVSNKPGYKFNPCTFMCDEAGANFNGLECMYGRHVLTKTITCQFHFYENMRKATHQKIKPDEQETFKNLMVALTKSATVEEYNR